MPLMENTNQSAKKHTPRRELVINWHITEACNYRCRYCYAKWQNEGMGTELIHDSASTRELLEEIYGFFSPGNSRNPLQQDMSWQSLRLNFAGGEPLLYGSKVLETIRIAREIGFNTSIISNGSRLDPLLMADLAPHLSVLGLSVDSSDGETNRNIGRSDRHERVIDMGALADTILVGRTLNPELRLKINTVVNALNWRDDMNEFIFSMAPEKWKVLRMLPTLTEDLSISDAQFSAFVRRHQALAHVMCAEDNSDMAESYIMVDPNGRFFQNALARKGYAYSHPILDVGAASAFSNVSLSPEKYRSRYSNDRQVIGISAVL